MTRRDDNPRHGTHANYNRGCRCDECRAATRNYHKRLTIEHAQGIRRKVPTLGTRRRIEALGALGWTGRDIAQIVGTHPEAVMRLCRQRLVYLTTAQAVARAYDELSMRLPPEDTHAQRHNVARQRNKARRLGWAPPLAWDDIDDPQARPVGMTRSSQHDCDPVVVERILAGDYKVPATAAERAEVIRQWVGTDNELERLTGWNVAREKRKAA